MTTMLRPMSVGETLDRTFRLYRTHFVLFIGIAAIPQLVILAIQTVVSGVQAAGIMTGGGAKSIAFLITGSLLGLVAYFAATTASLSATVVAVSEVHLDQPITIAEAYRRIRDKFFRVLGVFVGTMLGTALGFVLLIIPGIILGLKWVLAIPVAVVEDASFSVATSRSSDLTQGSKGRIFSVLLVISVLAYIVSIVLAIPIGIAAFSSARTGVIPFWVQGVNNAVTFVSNSLIGPLFTIAISVLYYDERVRKEGFDLQVLMRGTEAPVAAAAGQV